MVNRKKSTHESIGTSELNEETTAADSLKADSNPVADPKSKIEMIANVIGAVNATRQEDLVNWFNATMAQFGPNKDHGVPDNSEKNKATLNAKPSAAVGSGGPDQKDPMPKLNVKEDLDKMFDGQELSEDAKQKVATLFEVAVQARVGTEQVRLQEQFETKLTEAVEGINTELTQKVDSYLEYVVESWMNENEVAIESTLRNELMTEFIDGLQKLFTDHYISVPEEKINVLESLTQKVEELEQNLDEIIGVNAALKDEVVESKRKEIFESLSENLTLSQREKFKTLADGVTFDGDLEDYSKKLTTVKDSYFTEKKVATPSNIQEETFEAEPTTPKQPTFDTSMNVYADAITRSQKNTYTKK